VDCDVADLGKHSAHDYLTDTSTWDALLRRGAAGQAPASFTPTAAARKSASFCHPTVQGGSSPTAAVMSEGDRDMFLTMADPVSRSDSEAEVLSLQFNFIGSE